MWTSVKDVRQNVSQQWSFFFKEQVAHIKHEVECPLAGRNDLISSREPASKIANMAAHIEIYIECSGLVMVYCGRREISQEVIGTQLCALLTIWTLALAV